MTRMAGSFRCASSQSVSTSASGLAYVSTGPPFRPRPRAELRSGQNPIDRIGIMTSVPNGTQVEGRLEETERGLGFLRHHLGGPGGPQHHLGLDVADALH